MPRTEEANQRVRDEQRARILGGARAVFAMRGPAATMAEVAAEAGVSQGLAYRYFAGKDELFRELVRDALQPSESPDLTEGSPWARLEFLVSRLLDARRNHPEFFQIFYHVLSARPAPADLLELALRRRRQLTKTMRSLIVEGQASGEVAAGDPDQLVMVMLACLDGLSRLAMGRPEWSLRHLPDGAILMRMLRAPGR